MLLLDTNVVSALRRRATLPPHVREWAEAVDFSAAFLSTITLLELEHGILMVERRDTTQGATLRRWLDTAVLPQFAGRSLPVDDPVSRLCARLHVPDPRPERDALIAATALVHGLTMVTRNVQDFQPMGVTVFNPWSTPKA